MDDSSYLFPAFGYSKTSYEYLKFFYKKWAGFNTLKSFSWKDEYLYSRTYDRRTKREINKRNEKARQQARNEYNKTVKRFATFIKKIDQRMKDGAKKAEEEKKLKNELRRQQLDAMKKNRTNGNQVEQPSDFELQSWQAVDEDWDEIEKRYARADEITEEDLLTASKIPINDDEIIIYECFICSKNFKSEKQYENHVNTKLHKRRLNEIEKEIKKEHMEFGLDNLSDLDEFSSAAESVNGQEQDELAEKVMTDNINVADLDLDKLNEELAEIERQLAEATSGSDTEDEIEVEIDDVSSVESPDVTEEKQNKEGKVKNEPPKIEEESEEEEQIDELTQILASLNEKKFEDSDSDDDWSVGNKKKKKGRKGNNKKGKPSSSTVSSRDHTGVVTPEPTPIPTDGEICSTCGQLFDSRNKLFKHVKASGHAAPPSKVRKSKNKRK